MLKRTGAMILAHSLRDNGTQKQLVALVTLDSVSGAAVEELKVGDSNILKGWYKILMRIDRL